MNSPLVPKLYTLIKQGYTRKQFLQMFWKEQSLAVSGRLKT